MNTTLNNCQIVKFFNENIGKFLFFIIIFIAFSNSAEAAGMSEFGKISTWVQENLQGTLGKAVSGVALGIAVLQVGFGNPRMTVIAPIAIMLGLIWVAIPLINTIFA
jgi:hypothetical protein